MTQSDLLDILIGAIILLIALIGLWQGIGRTLLYLCGTFLGSELALWWADNLGDQLSDVLPLSDPTGRFVAATAMIVASLIVVGAGFSPLIWRYPKQWRNRLGGFIAGAALGAITLGLILRYYFLFLQSEAQSALGDTRFAVRLWQDFHLVVLISALALGLMVIVGWVMGAPEPERGPDYTAPVRRSAPASAAPRSDGPRFDMDPYAPVSSSPSHDSSATYRPAPVIPNPEPPFPVPGQQDAPNNGPDAEETARSRRDDAYDQSDSDYLIANALRDNPDYGVQRSAATEAVTYATEGVAERRESAGICPNCGMLLRKGDAFCPDCGFPAPD
jgi:uncharacterized membrane protein required for colicin V production